VISKALSWDSRKELLLNKTYLAAIEPSNFWTPQTYQEAAPNPPHAVASFQGQLNLVQDYSFSAPATDVSASE
jgi:hypothetical protein